MAKKYLDQQGLERLWGYISAADAAEVTARQNAVSAEATARENADNALDGRLDTIEATLGASGTIGSDVADLKTRMTGAEGDIDALEALHAANGESGKKTVAQEVTDGITALNLASTYAGKAYEGKVDTLIGSDTGKSARTIANEELATQLIPANAGEALDTLQEIAAWIQKHPGDASAMNSAIQALEAKTELGTYVPEGEEEAVQYATVKAYVEAYVAGQINTVNSAASALDGRVTTVEGKVSTLEGQMTTAQGDITTLQGRLGTATDTAAADGTTAWSRLKNAESDINTIKTGIGADGTSSTTTVWGRLNTAEGEIDALQTLVGNESVASQITSAIEDLDSSVAADTTGMSSDEVAVLTGVTQADGVLSARTSAFVAQVGTDSDTASNNTIYGAKKYAKDYADAIDANIQSLSNSEIDAACGKE